MGSTKKHKFADFFPDAALIAGYSAVCFGIWQLYHPAAWIVGGGILLWAFYPRSTKLEDKK